jgi:hypothetical protein
MPNCKVCNQEFPDDNKLHRHIRKHDLLLPEYYQTLWPRYDKFDGTVIKFRNKEQYLSTDFNSRINLRKWLETTDLPTVRAYCKALLETRRDKKALVWAPSQVELRTTLMPPIQFYDKIFGNYYALCEEIGLKNRFNLDARALVVSNNTPTFKILVDNREQLPLTFAHTETEWATIKFGDYACSDEKITCSCHIERKSPQDFVGTFSGGLERFGREMDRCVLAGSYMVVLVETTLTECLFFNYSGHFYKNTRVNPEFIFRNVRDLIQKYPNIQFLFVENREAAAATIERIFKSNCTYKDVDLQLAYDIGKL